MSRRQRKVSDELRGIGSIYSDSDNLGRARYQITVYQEYIVDRDGPIPTLKDIKGTISLIDQPGFNYQVQQRAND